MTVKLSIFLNFKTTNYQFENGTERVTKTTEKAH